MNPPTLLAGNHELEERIGPPLAREESSQPAADLTVLGLGELLLKDPAAVDRLNRRATNQRDLFPRFLALALASYLVFSLVMVLLLNLSPADPVLFDLALPPARWHDATAWSLPAAYTVSVVLAACVCLPSFYFYSLLAGLRMTWLQIVSVVAKGMAANSLMLLGVLPIYVAVMMGLVVFKAPPPVLQPALAAGLLLPFAAGLWGLRAIYLGTMDLFDHQTVAERCQRRCFLRRLTLSWAAVYTAVLPVMIFRLWELFAAMGRMSQL
jgi:hypothetical protein